MSESTKRADYSRVLAEAVDLAARWRTVYVVDFDGQAFHAKKWRDAEPVTGNPTVALPDGRTCLADDLQDAERDAKKAAERAQDAVTVAEGDVKDAQEAEAAYRRDAEVARQVADQLRREADRALLGQRGDARQRFQEAWQRLQVLESKVRGAQEQVKEAEERLEEARQTAVEAATKAAQSAWYRQ